MRVEGGHIRSELEWLLLHLDRRQGRRLRRRGPLDGGHIDVGQRVERGGGLRVRVRQRGPPGPDLRAGHRLSLKRQLRPPRCSRASHLQLLARAVVNARIAF